MAAEQTEQLTVHQAWAAVMGDVRALGKDQRNAQQGFNFRGVDDVMNAVGPVLRKHGVAVVPTGIDRLDATTYTTKSGTVMRDVVLVASYAITGPAGDTIHGAAAGEASDAGDKATPKAMSVAYRTFLLEALTLPTCETDPDAEVYDRAAEPTPDELADSCYVELTKATTVERARELGNLAHQRGLLDVEVYGTKLRDHVAARLQQLQHEADTANQADAGDPADAPAA